MPIAFEGLKQLEANVGREYQGRDANVQRVCVALAAALAVVENPNAMTLGNLGVMESLTQADSESVST